MILINLFFSFMKIGLFAFGGGHAMIPLIELRGAIPLGLSPAFGGELPVIPLYIVCILGNMVPVVFIYFFARKILEWGAKCKIKWIASVFKWLLNKGEQGGKAITAKGGRSVYVALILFVGIPIPGTGAWNGTLAASLLNLDFKKSVISIMLGILLSGIIMGLAAAGVFSFIF